MRNGGPGDECQSAWVGRGNFGADEWQHAPSQVQDVCEKHTIDYLFDTPLLPNSLD